MPTYDEWKVTNWDRAHREMDVSALTGTGLAGHLTVLGAEELATPGCNLLCVGVGTGSWVRQAVERDLSVQCLDVSPECKDHIPEGTALYTDPTELPSNTFDLALSLWVAPHMTNHDLECQVREVIRSLRPTGVFCIHYKEPLNDAATVDNREGADDEWRRAGAAGMMRRRRYFDSLVHWAGGKVIDRPVQKTSHFYQIVEVSAHVMRSER